ncbi:MAG: methyltransferase [Coriobacteriales bacterium]|nr:methyltransferase [Coriobacteriales bacterium]
MHGMHARLPKNFVLEERLERYANVIELEPKHLAGHWAQACAPLGPTGMGAFDEVRLDLGCGKGAFIVEAARREPNVLFVGMDLEPLCIAYAAQHVTEAGLTNAVIVPGRGSTVCEAFGPGELSRVYVNFPTPFPRKREAHKRLIILERLLEYRQVMASGATLCLRTDSQLLRDFALTQFELAGYTVVWSSDDERAQRPNEPTSEYEGRLAEQGAKVLGLWAIPGPAPRNPRQTAPLSLVDYLPDDLFDGGYVPHGMERTVENLRNQYRGRVAGR